MKNAFVIMPFDDEIANSVYEHCTRPICKELNLPVERADEIFTSNPILDDIILAIEKSAVIIADISGENSNVFYELGMCHMLKRKQTIMITHDEFDGIPFDISHFRIIQYKNTIPGKTIYEEHLRKTLENILQDYKLIYKDEYELLITFLISSEEYKDISYSLMALEKSPEPIHDDEIFYVEGHNKNIGQSIRKGMYSIESDIEIFYNLGYCERSGYLVILTDKGKAFIEVLEEKGFVCDFVNGHILSDGYIPDPDFFPPLQIKNRHL